MKLPVAVYGTLWEEFLSKDYIKGLHIDNRELRTYYSNCKILLNDHWDSMRDQGFLSNRLFDAGACEACIITDPVSGLEEVFGDSVVIYRTPEELRRLVEYYLKEDDKRREKAEKAREIVRSTHTFRNRVEKIVQVVMDLRTRKEESYYRIGIA